MDEVAEVYKRTMNIFNQKYEPYVRQHLAKVYLTLSSTSAITAIGALLQVKGHVDFGVSRFLAFVLLFLGLHFYRNNDKNYYSRLAILYAFGFFSGQILAPLLQIAANMNPSIIIKAIIGTMIMFGSLSLAALFAEHGQFLFFGGLISTTVSLCTLIMLLSCLHIELGIFHVVLFIAAGFVLFDTQNIIEEVRAGRTDFVQHALYLIFDVVLMFLPLIVILIQKGGHNGQKCRLNQNCSKNVRVGMAPGNFRTFRLNDSNNDHKKPKEEEEEDVQKSNF